MQLMHKREVEFNLKGELGLQILVKVELKY